MSSSDESTPRKAMVDESTPGESKGIVYVVDDDPDVLDSLDMLLSTVGYEVACHDGPNAFRERLPVDGLGCLVLDVRMPSQTGIELYEQLLREGVRLPVIFITAHADVSTAVAAMKTGAIEFLEKPFDRKSLLDLVEKALTVGAVWRRRDAEFSELDARISQLTRRDRETLAMLVEGLLNKQMASRLGITERAVEMRRAALLKKLDVASTAELLELAITHRVLVEVRETSKHPCFTIPAPPPG